MQSSRQAISSLGAAAVIIDEAITALSGEIPAGHAAFAALLIEELVKITTRAQIHGAHAVRRTGAHKLDSGSLQAIRDAGLHPQPEQIPAGHTTTERTHYKKAADLLSGWLQIPISTARERIGYADALIARVDDAGQSHKPTLGLLAAEFSGDIDPRLILSTARKIKSADKSLGTGRKAESTRRRLQRDAIGFMRQQPATARRHINTLVSQAIGDKRPKKALLAQAGVYRQGLKQGLEHILIKCLPTQAEAFYAIFRSIDNPKTIAGNRQALAQMMAKLAGTKSPMDWDDHETMPDWAGGAGKEPEDKPVDATAFEDLRPELRHLIGLMSVIQANGPGSPISAQVTVILDYEKMLRAGSDFAVTASGIPISAPEARAMLCNARFYPMVLGGQSEILDYGRSRRLYSQAQARAIRAAYRGCAYPGCSMPAQRCELDHLDKWELGGATDLHSADLYCTVHHIGRHCGLFRAVKVPGSRPMVLLPEELDPQQRLQFNTYYFSPSEAAHLQQLADDATRAWKAGELEVNFAEA